VTNILKLCKLLIDQISCGTTIKVIDPSKKLGKYQGNGKDMVLNIHNSNNEPIK
jgi:hypothetical protein